MERGELTPLSTLERGRVRKVSLGKNAQQRHARMALSFSGLNPVKK